MNIALPSSYDNIKSYLKEIKQFPMLSKEDEYILAVRWRDHGDIGAAHKLVTSHLRYVVKMAYQYRGYGVSMQDLISEGNIGLMKSLKMFDPDKGVRFVTYAMWWIRSAIREFIMKNWSLVKINSGAKDKRLFYNLRREKKLLKGDKVNEDLTPEEIKSLAKTLDAAEQDIIDMDTRFRFRESSIHSQSNKDGLEDSSITLEDQLADTSINFEQELEDKSENDYQKKMITKALSTLTDSEQIVIKNRFLVEDSFTLREISKDLGVSHQRVQQIEAKALKKLAKIIQAA